MWVRFFTLGAMEAVAPGLWLVCSECGSHVEMPLDHLIEKFGQDCTVSELVQRARCRECGGLVVASPTWEE